MKEKARLLRLAQWALQKVQWLLWPISVGVVLLYNGITRDRRTH